MSTSNASRRNTTLARRRLTRDRRGRTLHGRRLRDNHRCIPRTVTILLARLGSARHRTLMRHLVSSNVDFSGDTANAPSALSFSTAASLADLGGPLGRIRDFRHDANGMSLRVRVGFATGHSDTSQAALTNSPLSNLVAGMPPVFFASSFGLPPRVLSVTFRGS